MIQWTHEAFRDLPVNEEQGWLTLKSLPALEFNDFPSVPHQKSILALSKMQSSSKQFFL